MWMKKALVGTLGISVLLAVSACASTPKPDYTPGCSTQLVKVWDPKLNKWVQIKKPVCSLGNIY